MIAGRNPTISATWLATNWLRARVEIEQPESEHAQQRIPPRSHASAANEPRNGTAKTTIAEPTDNAIAIMPSRK